MPLSTISEAVVPVEHGCRALCRVLAGKYAVEAQTPAPAQLHVTEHSSGTAALILVEAAGSPLSLRRLAVSHVGLVHVHIQLEGHCVYREEGNEVRLDPGSFCLCRADSAADIEWPEAFRGAVVAVPEARLSKAFPDWPQRTALRLTESDGAAAVFVDTVRSLLRHPASLRGAAGQGVAETLIGLLAAVLTETAGRDGGADSRLESYHKQRIQKFIRAELSNPDLDIALIARAVGLSQRYIHRLFADEPLHLMQSVWAQRLDHCHHELTQARSIRRPISDIAYAWGFNDPAHFSRVFRKRFGLTPSVLRQQAAPLAGKSHHVGNVGTFEQATFQS